MRRFASVPASDIPQDVQQSNALVNAASVLQLPATCVAFVDARCRARMMDFSALRAILIFFHAALARVC